MTTNFLKTKQSIYYDFSYEATKTKALECKNCKLFNTRNRVVFSQGPVPCKLMIIGEAPGADEDEQGVPFVGKAGKLLEKMLLAIDIRRPEDVYIANTLKCRPPNNRKPLQEEINSCNDFLLKQIAEVKPKIILLLGSPAMETILNPTESISKIRGKWFNVEVDYQSEDIKIMTIFHPAYLLRNPSSAIDTPKWLTWQDLQLVKAEYNALTVVNGEIVSRET